MTSLRLIRRIPRPVSGRGIPKARRQRPSTRADDIIRYQPKCDHRRSVLVDMVPEVRYILTTRFGVIGRRNGLAGDTMHPGGFCYAQAHDDKPDAGSIALI